MIAQKLTNIILDFSSNTTIAIIYRNDDNKRYLQRARRIVIAEIERQNIGVRLVQEYTIILDNACRLIFINEDNQQRELRGYRLDSVEFISPANYISEDLKYALHSEVFMKTCIACKRSYVYKPEKEYTGKSDKRCPECQIKFEEKSTNKDERNKTV